MKIIIPSLGRAGTGPTMKWIRGANREIFFAVHPDEIAAYYKAYPDVAGFIDLPEETRHHVGLVRKWLMQQIREPFFFVDDDIRIGLKANLNIEQCFDVLEKHINSGVSMAGFGQQLFCNSQIEKTVIINGDAWAIRDKFVSTVYAINPLHFDECPLDTLPIYEDIALIIHAIQHSGTIVTYVATHNNISPPGGGDNLWRTKEATVECLYELVRLYPGICSIKETKNKTHSQDIGIGLRTEWSKIRRTIQ